MQINMQVRDYESWEHPNISGKC